MDNSTFLRVKLSGKKPQFKDMIGLQESNKTSTLIDFCTMMHKNADKIAQGSICDVYTKKSHYRYHVYSGCIVRTNVHSGAKVMYKL